MDVFKKQISEYHGKLETETKRADKLEFDTKKLLEQLEAVKVSDLENEISLRLLYLRFGNFYILRYFNMELFLSYFEFLKSIFALKCKDFCQSNILCSWLGDWYIFIATDQRKIIKMI